MEKTGIKKEETIEPRPGQGRKASTEEGVQQAFCEGGNRPQGVEGGAYLRKEKKIHKMFKKKEGL